MESKYEEKSFTKIVLESLSYSEVCKKINLIPIGGNLKTVKKYIIIYKIDISHFTGSAWNVGKRYRNFRIISLDDILIENSTYTNNRKLKYKLFDAGLKENKCECCSLTEWNNKPINLELHHINGNNTDNRLGNLQILCPNCHCQTDNFKGKNKVSFSNKKFKEEHNIITKQDYYKKKKNKVCSCGNDIKDSRAKTCRDCYLLSIKK